MEQAEQLICLAIRGDAQAWPAGSDPGAIARFIELLRYHGMAALFDRAMRDTAARASWPAAILEHCRAEALGQTAREMAHRAELPRVLSALAESGIKALLLKGASLAYSHYENPVLRPRGDTDLLIPRSSRLRAEEILSSLGYVRFPAMRGEVVSYQASWSLEDSLRMVHELDLHWRVNNSQVLAKLLEYDELEPRAITLPHRCANSYGLAPVDALLLACLHRAGHGNAPYYVNGIAYPARDRLIWLYDIHLLVSGMPTGELEEFSALAAHKRMKVICRDSLIQSVERFGTPIPASVMEALRPTGPIEPSARYCSSGPASQIAQDFASLSGIGEKTRWLTEQALPPADYMRNKYRGAAVVWLPLLYARRFATGLWRLTLAGLGARSR